MTEDVTQDVLVHELRLAFEDELTTLRNYLAMGEFLEGPYAQGIVGEELVNDVDEEASHAKKLAKRITELDGKPPYSTERNVSQSVVDSVEDETDVREAVEAVIELEREAVNRYSKIVELSRELGDDVTRDLAEELLADEEEHLDEFEGFLNGM